MEQELISTSKRTCIIGAGPAGCMCAKILSDGGIDVTLIDKKDFLHTILPTGNKRCNLANAIYDFKELPKNYPRGEKFLYSVFSQFSTKDTVDFFKSIDIDTYVQDDNRIFPLSNSSKEVREKLLKSIKCKFIKENVTRLKNLSTGYKIKTDKAEYYFDNVVVAIGGHNEYSILNDLDINIIPPVQSLVGLITGENFSDISGVSLKNTKAKIDSKVLYGDIIFTHNGISGPLIYKISSLNARKNLPYKINISFTNELDFQQELNNNSHKEIKNLLSKFVPKSLGIHLLNSLDIDINAPCHKINSQMRNSIYDTLTNFEIIITGKFPNGEIVTCGGVDLKEVNSKTMESKKYKNLFFCGEILDIDGFCGGFNLQNCWSTGYVAARAILNK